MKGSLALISWLLLGLSIVFLILLTLFESAFVGLSTGTERLITFFVLVLLPAIGAALGVMSLVRKEGQMWLAILATALNSLFALFHLMLVIFAG